MVVIDKFRKNGGHNEDTEELLLMYFESHLLAGWVLSLISCHSYVHSCCLLRLNTREGVVHWVNPWRLQNTFNSPALPPKKDKAIAALYLHL